MRHSSIQRVILSAAALCAFVATVGLPARAADSALHLRAKSRIETAPGSGQFAVIERAADWDAKQTAVIVIDVWDQHWCKSANERLAPLVPRMNAVVSNMRERGALIIHAPSDTMQSYEGTPQRKLAQSAPPAAVPTGIEFKWQYLDAKKEGKLPIVDSDGGCDDDTKCKDHKAWTRQHAGIEAKPGDAVSDQGREIYNLLEQRGVKNVVIFGVHCNMCILGRPFGIRQMTKLGKNVVLVRDLTDTMYDHRQAPFVPHAKGTDLMIEHVERNWCPTITASQLLGEPDPQPKVVIVAAEQEYHAKETLPAFAKAELEKRGLKCTVLVSDDVKSIPGIEALDDADLLILFARRRELPPEELSHFRKYFDSGKPVVGLRTASHAFQNDPGFDKRVLGGNYQNHFGNEGPTKVSATAGAKKNPILDGIPTTFESKGSLYKNAPLPEGSVTLLDGKWNDKPEEPVAWTHWYMGGRVFYTSLGHPEDFQTPAFRRLLLNGIFWAIDRPIPVDEKAN